MRELTGSEIAITGMALRFPGADSPQQLWENLRNGVESIRVFTGEELRAAGVNPAVLEHPSYVKARPALDGIDLFDADLFSIPPREARLLDPQHRIFLECAWEALERAGCDSESYPGLIGVYAGTDLNSYLLSFFTNRALIAEVGILQVELASDKEYMASRVSYKLDLRGPSLAVQTACSTSLVAVHLACQGLLSGECDMALAGGASVRVPQITGYLAPDGSIHSPDGHCRAFDARAHGSVFGCGVGVVVLKRLTDALEDGDLIHAVIKGSAINNDGSRKVGFTAPGGEGQARVIRAAQLMSEVDPETITYVEAHGTGTPLGDPIEIAALTQAFRASTDRKGFCALGSVKTNLGHLATAAGAAGLIKTVLALEHRELPPSLHLERPNPHIDFANSPFFVNDRLREWRPAENAPLRAAVSSFGIGGTNAHVILEEAPPAEPSGPSRPWQVVPLSAASASALERVRGRLADHFRQHSGLCLADAAWTLRVGRRAGRHRAFVVARDLADAVAALESPERVQTAFQELRDRPMAFLFPGQGAQHPGMARGLYENEPTFRAHLDRCCEILRPLLGLDLRETLFPAPGAEERAARRLERTELAQPALFAVEHSLARLWMEWGVRPRALLGHSLGEYVAACLAGIFSLEDALALVAERGRLMQALPPGAMLSVPLPEEELHPRLGSGLALAAVNGPGRCVVSGEEEAVAALEAELDGQGIAVRRLDTSHAFHSAAMDPVLAPFAERVRRVRRKAPVIPFLSNLTGTWITAEQATDPDYWSRHLRATVRFGDGLRTLAEDEKTVLLEVGPGQTLAAFARQLARSAGRAVIGSLPHPKDARCAAEHLMDAVGRLWLAGVPVDWRSFDAHERRLRIELPTYPFERKRYWIDGGVEGGTEGDAAGVAAGTEVRRKADIADWFHVPCWKPSAPPEDPAGADGRWLLLSPDAGLGATLERRLAALGGEVVVVEPTEAFAEVAPGRFALSPGDRDGWAALFARLRATGALPERVLHLWGLGEAGEDRCVWSLLWLGQELGRLGLPGVQLRVVTDGLQSVSGEPAVLSRWAPEKALALGPVRVLPLEHPEIGCAALDVIVPDAEEARERLADRLIAEALAPVLIQEPVVAWRGEERWVEAFEPVRLGAAGRLPFPQRGVCLVTGGLGGIGLTLARELARSASARVVLTGRSAPERGHAAVRELEELGAEVLVLSADVTDEAAMREVVRRTRERFGPVQAVIHAAGVPGGGVIQRKTAEAAAQVLAPKVRGTRVLAAALEGEPLELLVLCSSTFAVTGGVGQVDYCAANAFLDAFARQAAQRGLRAISLDWGAWQGVGMAVGAVQAAARTLPAGPDTSLRPLLDRRLVSENGADGAVYATDFSPSRHWVLAEHRLLGTPTVPGTAWLEMARAAFALETGAEAVDIRDVTFVSPLLVPEGDRREARIVLEADGEWTAFRVISRTGEAGQEHARGSLRRLDGEPPAPRDLAALAARCSVRELVREGGGAAAGSPVEKAERLVSWGPRWQSLRRADLGDGEALVTLELPAEFASEVEALPLHPALLDVATAFGGSILTAGNALPQSYRRVAVHGPLPSHLLAHVRAGGKPDPDAATVVMDITLMDERGGVRVEVEGFTMKRTAERTREAAPAGRGAAWIHPTEGVEAFRRALSRGRFHQVAISPADLGAAVEAARRQAAAREAGPSRPVAAFDRPSQATAYAAPSTGAEAALAEIWQRVLGLDQVGINDNFFDLGGDSVVAIKVIAQSTARGLSLTPEQLFEHQTIAVLARLLEAAPTAAPGPAAEPGVSTRPFAPGEATPTLADFPEADLSQASLDRLFARLEDRP